LKKESLTQDFSFSISAVFVGNSVTPTLANNKRSSSCSKRWKTLGQNCVFPVFWRKIWHDFVTPFSTTPDRFRLRCWTRTDGEDFPGFWPIFFFRTSSTKVFSKDPASSPDLHPKRSLWPDFRDWGVIFSRDKCWPKKKKRLGAASL